MAPVVIDNSERMQQTALAARQQGHTIGFVPTMGYLHDGHLSLMKLAADHCDVLVISVFVNPTQFGPNEDLDAYPRDFKRDLDLAANSGVDYVFAPPPEAMYPDGYQTYVELERLPRGLCGRSRPGHFRGVATIVTKLFNIVQPHVAVFGEKDFQQLAVIRRMVRDLDMPVRVIGGETVRESDGLAMSSRNAYLTPEQRPAALSLYRALTGARDRVAAGARDARAIVAAAREAIDVFPDTEIDYIHVIDPDTLEDVDDICGPVRMALAVRVGRTRLIDNMALVPEP